jgi:hypothetical protein
MQWTDPVVLGRQIRLLDDTRFVELMNALVSETAAKHGIARSCIATNLNIKEPDGGIDCRCVGASTPAGRLIPGLDVDYQFKGGSTKKSLAKIVAEDIKGKPRVLEGLKSGHAFVFAAAWDRGDEMEDDLVKKLREEGVSVDDGQVVFITGDTIAQLLQTFPGLVARFLGWDMPLVGIEEWSTFRSLRNPFQIDDALQSTIDILRAQVEKPRSITRIVIGTSPALAKVSGENTAATIDEPALETVPPSSHLASGFDSTRRVRDCKKCFSQIWHKY